MVDAGASGTDLSATGLQVGSKDSADVTAYAVYWFEEPLPPDALGGPVLLEPPLQ